MSWSKEQYDINNGETQALLTKLRQFDWEYKKSLRKGKRYGK